MDINIMLYIVLNTIHDMSMTLSETSMLMLWSSNNYTTIS